VNEIESGKFTKSEASRIYDIRGGSTINCWIKKLGKTDLLNKIVRIEMKGEKDKIKQLEKDKRELESALAQAHVKLLAYETLIEVAEEDLGIDLKKNINLKQFKGQKKKSITKIRNRR